MLGRKEKCVLPSVLKNDPALSGLWAEKTHVFIKDTVAPVQCLSLSKRCFKASDHFSDKPRDTAGIFNINKYRSFNFLECPGFMKKDRRPKLVRHREAGKERWYQDLQYVCLLLPIQRVFLCVLYPHFLCKLFPGNQECGVYKYTYM